MQFKFEPSKNNNNQFFLVKKKCLQKYNEVMQCDIERDFKTKMLYSGQIDKNSVRTYVVEMFVRIFEDLFPEVADSSSDEEFDAFIRYSMVMLSFFEREIQRHKEVRADSRR